MIVSASGKHVIANRQASNEVELDIAAFAATPLMNSVNPLIETRLPDINK